MQQNLPNHVAVIPDGNRRWARLRGLPDENGHREGRAIFHKTSRVAFNLGIPYFTFWATSEDNHTKRSITEISSLVSLLKEALESSWVKELFENQIRFRVLGNWRKLSATKHLASLIDKLQWQTRSFNKYNLTVILGYDGEHEAVETIRANAENWHYWNQLAESDFEKIRKVTFWTADLPPVDLEVRTGETMERWSHNSSGFMMFHTTNAERHFSPTLWPDFSEQEFKKIIEEYGQRERKFGK